MDKKASRHNCTANGFQGLQKIPALGRGCTALPVDCNPRVPSLSKQHPVWWSYVEAKDVRQEGGGLVAVSQDSSIYTNDWVNYWAVLTTDSHLLLYRKHKKPVAVASNDLRCLSVLNCRAAVFCLLRPSRHIEYVEDSTLAHLQKERRNRQRLVKVSLASGAALVFRCRTPKAALSLAASLHGFAEQGNNSLTQNPCSDGRDRNLKRQAKGKQVLTSPNCSASRTSEGRPAVTENNAQSHASQSASSGNTGSSSTRRSTVAGETQNVTLTGLIMSKLRAKRSKPHLLSVPQPAMTVNNGQTTAGADGLEVEGTVIPLSPDPSIGSAQSSDSNHSARRGVLSSLRTRLSSGRTSRSSNVERSSSTTSLSSAESASIAENAVATDSLFCSKQNDDYGNKITDAKDSLWESDSARASEEWHAVSILDSNYVYEQETAKPPESLETLQKRLFLLQCQLKERQELLEQLDYQLHLFCCQEVALSKSCERKMFKASLANDYIVAPGREETKLLSGAEVNIFGLLPNDRWRFSSGNTCSLLHCPPRSLHWWPEHVSYEQDWHDLELCAAASQTMHGHSNKQGPIPRSYSLEGPPRLAQDKNGTSSVAHSMTASVLNRLCQGTSCSKARSTSLAASSGKNNVQPKKILLPSSVKDGMLRQLLSEVRGRSKTATSCSFSEVSENWAIASAAFSIYPLLGSLPGSAVNEVELPESPLLSAEPTAADTAAQVSSSVERIDIKMFSLTLQTLSVSLSHLHLDISSSDDEIEDGCM